MNKRNSKPYLKDVFDIEQYIKQGKNKIFLIAGVSSGKSTWVKDVLSKKGNVLFITSRKAKAEQDKQYSCFRDVYEWNTNENQTLITNAKLSFIVEDIIEKGIRDLDEFLNLYEYIVVDEVHSIATDSLFAESCFGLLSFIEYAVKKEKNIIAMTGTPEPIEAYFKNNDWEIVDYRKECNYVHPASVQIIYERNIIEYICKSYNDRKIIYFANERSTISSLCEKVLEHTSIKVDEIATIVSNAKEKKFREELKKRLKNKADKIIQCSEDTYNSIIEKSSLPDKCKILFCTSVLREGIDIKNDDLTIFCENHILSNLIQFFGRARGSNTQVYVIEDITGHMIEREKIVYEYAISKAVEGANEFYKARFLTNDDKTLPNEKRSFIKHVMKNQYIYFDFIEDKFKIFHIRFDEESRLLKNKYWKDKLQRHCDEYDIIYIDYVETVMKDALRKMARKEMKFYLCNKENEIIKKALYYAYKIKAKHISKINAELEQHGVKLEIKAKTDSKGDMRNNRYWQVYFVKE